MAIIKQQNMFGINPLLFQNSIFYNTVIYCYMCDLMGNVQCPLIMKHSHKVFLSTYQYSMIVRSLCWYIYLVLTAQLTSLFKSTKALFLKVHFKDCKDDCFLQSAIMYISVLTEGHTALWVTNSINYISNYNIYLDK